MKKTVLLVFCGVLAAGGLFAQAVDLEDALNKKQLTLTANGNGGSSGASLDGYLENRTAGTLKVHTVIKRGIYLVNSGAGQNMAAVAVYLADGSYFSDGAESFIELGPKTKTAVMLIAFCADFEKENPVSGERFRPAAMPAGIAPVVSKISRYMADHPGDDIITAAQLALWLSQGETPASIAKKFSFSRDDEDLAKTIFAY